MRNFFAIILLGFLLSACVSPARIVDQNTKPTQQSAYIAGVFFGKAVGAGFGIGNKDTGTDTLFPFFPSHFFNADQAKQFRMIAVPAGTYSVNYWATYDPANRQITKSYLHGGAFTAKPGQITFIGQYEMSNYMLQSFTLKRQAITQEQVVSLMKISYPEFSEDLLNLIP